MSGGRGTHLGRAAWGRASARRVGRPVAASRGQGLDGKCHLALPLGLGGSDDAHMTAATPELLIVVAVLVLLAVAAGTFARLFMAASRPRSGASGADPKL